MRIAPRASATETLIGKKLGREPDRKRNGKEKPFKQRSVKRQIDQQDKEHEDCGEPYD